MRVLFIQDHGINESLAVCDLSAMLRARGHETGLLLQAEEPRLMQRARRFEPDLVVLPVGVLAHNWAVRMSRELRSNVDCPVVLGGLTPTFFPDLLTGTEADYLVQGEAELAVLDLVAALERSLPVDDIPNLVLRTPAGPLRKNPPRILIPDLDALPLPDRGLYYEYPFMRDFPWKKFSGSRGCVHACSYCHNMLLRDFYAGKGELLRRKSARRVVDEVLAVRAQARLERVHFSDDLFATDPAWVERFAQLYRREVALPFSVNLSVEYVTPPTVSALAAAGCRMIAVGVEVADEARRNSLLNKTLTNEEIRRAADLIRGHGVELTTFNMVGCPGETFEDAFETLRFSTELGADFGRCTIALPLPGTQFFERARALGLVQGEAGGGLVDLPDLRALRFEAAPGSGDGDRITHLYHLFALGVAHPRLLPVLRLAARLPGRRWTRAAHLYSVYQEKRINGISWLEGLRFFRHVGPPHHRNTVMVFLM